MKTLTPKQAAVVIGCSPQQVRYLIYNKKIKAIKIKTDCNQHGYRFAIPKNEAQRYADKPQTVGYPRGVQRKPKDKK